MPLEIKQRIVQGIIILDLTGRLVLGPEDLELGRVLQALLDADQKNIILNLQAVSHIDTAAEGSLISSRDKFDSVGGRLVLLHVPPAHGRIDELLKLDTAMNVYQNEPDAVNGFFPDRAVTHYDILDFLDEEAAKGGEPAKESA
jgi:anti-anti-sigma factor